MVALNVSSLGSPNLRGIAPLFRWVFSPLLIRVGSFLDISMRVFNPFESFSLDRSLKWRWPYFFFLFSSLPGGWWRAKLELIRESRPFFPPFFPALSFFNSFVARFSNGKRPIVFLRRCGPLTIKTPTLFAIRAHFSDN